MNCYQGKCLSCISGQSLDQNTGVCGSCLSGQSTLLEERLCISNTCELNKLITRISDTTCTRQCSNPSSYYLPSNGCANTCPSICKTCNGPAITNCLSCYSPRVLNLQTYSCDCPVGTNASSNGNCISISTIALAGDIISQSCTDFQLTASIRKDESQAYTIKYTWSLARSTANQASTAAIKNYLANQNSSIIFVPNSLLERNNQYNYTVSYTNIIGDVFTAFLVTRTIADYIPNINIDGGNNQILTSSKINQIVALATYSQCWDLSQPVQVQWSYVSGQALDVNSLYSPQTPLKLQIPKCTLQPNTWTVIQFKAWIDKYTWLSQTQTINITVLSEEFDIGIVSGNRESPQDVNLTLSGYVINTATCSSSASITYSWSCYKAIVTLNQTNNTVTSDNDVNSVNIANSEMLSTFAVLNEVEDSYMSYDFDYYNNNDTVHFVMCSDPDKIFNRSSLNSTIIVPTYYFQQGDILQFNLTGKKGNFLDTASTQVAIQSTTELLLDINLGNIQKYTSNLEYQITGQVVTKITIPETFQYNWTILPYIPSISFQNQLKIAPNTIGLDNSVDFLKIMFSVQSTDYYGSTFSLLPINRPPANGTVVIFPSSGTSLSTYFSIVTDDWSDDDLPLSYQFTYAFADNPSMQILLTEPQYTPQTSTFLPGKSPGVAVILQVTARDSLGASSVAKGTVVVKSSATDLETSIANAQTILDSLEDYDPFEKLKVIAVLNSEICQWEDEITSTKSTQPCPDCSGNGFCLSNITRCECNAGWTLADCSLKETDYQALMAFKQESLQEIQNNTDMYSTDAGKEMLYSILSLASENAIFSNIDSLSIIQGVLEDSLNITNNSTTLNDDEATSISKILSNMLMYSAVYDCAGMTSFTQQLRNKTTLYLNKISQSTLASKLPGENSTVITTSSFDIYLEKVNLCDLDNRVISTSPGSPQLSFDLTAEQNKNCSYEVNLQYYAFSDGLMECSTNVQAGDKTHLALQFSNAVTGEVINISVAVNINFEGGHTCPSKCTTKSDGTCHCSDLTSFNIKDQVKQIFTLSQISLLFNLKALLSFEFWQAGSFLGAPCFHPVVFSYLLYCQVQVSLL